MEVKEFVSLDKLSHFLLKLKTIIPTKVSELDNDLNFAPKATSLSGYGISDAYTKTETDNKIQTAVSKAGHLKRLVVESLPSVAEADPDAIYMVLADEASEDNKYIEYMLVNGKYEKTGDTSVDLSGYWQTEALMECTNEQIDALFE